MKTNLFLIMVWMLPSFIFAQGRFESTFDSEIDRGELEWIELSDWETVLSESYIPDGFEGLYLYFMPGDEYVDVFGDRQSYVVFAYLVAIINSREVILGKVTPIGIYNKNGEAIYEIQSENPMHALVIGLKREPLISTFTRFPVYRDPETSNIYSIDSLGPIGIDMEQLNIVPKKLNLF
jgi:hypothetical protein